MKAARKNKKNNTPQQQIPADFLMMAVQLYSSMVNNARQNRRQGGKVEYKAEGLLSEIFKQLQDRNKAIDVQSLFHSLHYLLSWKTFDDISEGKTVVQELQALNIEPPALVQNCLKEIEMRSRKVKDFAAGKHQWSEEKIQNWKDEIESKLLAYSYDNSSRKNYLAGLFSDVVSEIKRLENEAVAKYGYYIDSFYNADTFKATENELNDLFFHGETFAGGYTAFHNIYLLLIKYIDKHNEVVLLKNLIEKRKRETEVSDPQNLKEAWTKDEAHYNKVMEFLKEVSPTIGCSFINDKLQWQKFPHSIKYLAAFTWMCIDKEHIENKYSAPDYQRIYHSTFGITFNPKPFKSIITKDFTGCLDAFVNMP